MGFQWPVPSEISLRFQNGPPLVSRPRHPVPSAACARSRAPGLTCVSHACSLLPSAASAPRQAHPHLGATSAAATAPASETKPRHPAPPPALGLPRLPERTGAGLGRTAARLRALPRSASARRRRGEREVPGRARVGAPGRARRWRRRGRCRDQWQARAPAPVGAPGAALPRAHIQVPGRLPRVGQGPPGLFARPGWWGQRCPQRAARPRAASDAHSARVRGPRVAAAAAEAPRRWKRVCGPTCLHPRPRPHLSGGMEDD